MDSKLSHGPIPHGNFGVNFISLGQYDKSLAESEEWQRLGPNNFISYLNLGLAYLALNRPDHAKATFEQALARKLDGGGLRLSLYYLGSFARRFDADGTAVSRAFGNA